MDITGVDQSTEPTLRRIVIIFERTDFCDPAHSALQDKEVLEVLETPRSPLDVVHQQHISQLRARFQGDERFRVVGVTPS